MPPYIGSIHRRPRSDSGAARLWAWARRKRSAWTIAAAAEAAQIEPRTARKIVAALVEEGLIDTIVERGSAGKDGWTPAEFAMTEAGRKIDSPPILVMAGQSGVVAGVRIIRDPANDRLRQSIEASGLATSAAACALGLNPRTLRRMMAGELPIAADDPVFQRLPALKRA